MKIKNIGANRIVIEPNDNLSVLVSYETPVAAWISGRGYVKTSKKWSRTTSKHITQWIPMPCKLSEEPQEFFDNLLNSNKAVA